jgi:hypothetical protein
MNKLFDDSGLQETISFLHYLYSHNEKIKTTIDTEYVNNKSVLRCIQMGGVQAAEISTATKHELERLSVRVQSVVVNSLVSGDDARLEAQRLLEMAVILNKKIKDKKTTRNIRLFKESIVNGDISKTYESHLRVFLKNNSSKTVEFIDIRKSQLSFGKIQENIREIIPGNYIVFRHSYADKDYINISPLRIREDNGDFFYENERVSKNSLLHYSSEGVVYQVSNKTVILDGIAASLKEGNKNRFPEFISLRVTSHNSSYFYENMPMSGLYLGLIDSQTPAFFMVLLLPIKPQSEFKAMTVINSEDSISSVLNMIYDDRKLPLNRSKKVDFHLLTRSLKVNVSNDYNGIKHFKNF